MSQIFTPNFIFSMLLLKIPNGNDGEIDLTLQTKVRIKTAELIDGTP
jgi:hypothetical protein